MRCLLPKTPSPLCRALAADNPTEYQARLAAALNTLSRALHELGRYHDMLTVVEEAVRELASQNEDMYRDQYRRSRDALRREYDLYGMTSEAILHDLTEPPTSS